MAITLSHAPDGFGFYYGHVTNARGDRIRIDLLPPASQWRGDIKPRHLDPHDWIMFADGEEIARAASRDDCVRHINAWLSTS